MSKITRLRKLWNKIKGLDAYVHALLVAIPVACVLLAYLIGAGETDLVFSDWFINYVSIPNFFANQLATSAYFGGLTDMFRLHRRQTPNSRTREFIGTTIGLILGVTVGIGFSIMHIAMPLASSLFALANVFFTFRQINIFAGLGNRVGRCADPRSRPYMDKIIIGSACLLGLALGIALFATSSAGVVSVAGITSLFNSSASIPAWIAGGLFIINVSSALASTFDYAAKGISFIRHWYRSLGDGWEETFVEKRRYEHGASLIGVLTGLSIGIGIVIAIGISNPLILSGMAGVVAGTLVITTSASIIGSIFSRIGRLVDELSKDGPPSAAIALRANSYQRLPFNPSNTDPEPSEQPQGRLESINDDKYSPKDIEPRATHQKTL